MTRTRASSRPSIRATSERMRNGAWVDVHSVSSPVVASQAASAPRGSIGTPASRFCCTVTSTTLAAPAKAPSGSPARHVWPSARLPGASSKSLGAPAASAAPGVATPASSSYVASISATASQAAATDSATTAATGVPWAWTRSPASNGLGGTIMSRKSRFTGSGPMAPSSAAVTTATTPGAFLARWASTRTMRA